MTGCPDENTLVAYAERTLDAAGRSAVEAHLDGCSACLAIACLVARGEMTGTRVSNARAALHDTVPAIPARRELSPGAVVGRYRITRLIGEGGMGSVYEAYDPELDRNVAIKLLRGDASVPAMRARLVREARTMAQLSHPNVVAVFDAGAAGEDFFLAMELLKGTTLAEWLARPGRSYDDALRVLTAAGRGLSAAHAAGIVHRDFKPGNVLVGDDGRVAVTDFGLAAAPRRGFRAGARTVRSPSLGLTLAGSVLGTPRYMSPEQRRGEPLDARSDQFSFGIVLYEALYGQRAFAGESLHELVLALEMGVPRPPPANAAAPAHVRDAIARALAKDPKDRFPSVDELLSALTRPDGPERAVVAKAERSIVRRPWLLAAAVAALAATVVALVRLYPVSRAASSPSAGAVARTASVRGTLTRPRADPHEICIAATRAGVAPRAHAPIFVAIVDGPRMEPETLAVSPGTRVVFENRDSSPHSLVETEGAPPGRAPWRAEAIEPRGRREWVATTEGRHELRGEQNPALHAFVVVDPAVVEVAYPAHDGAFTFAGLPPGDYVLEAFLQGNIVGNAPSVAVHAGPGVIELKEHLDVPE